MTEPMDTPGADAFFGHLADSDAAHLPRTFRDVAEILGEELDSMGADFDDIGREVHDGDLMSAEFSCDGKRYRLELRPC